MQARRSKLGILGALVLLVATAPAAANALVAAVPGGAGARVASRSTVVLHEYVPSAGVFDVVVSIDSRSEAAGPIELRIGTIKRRTAPLDAHRRLVVRVRLPLRGRSLTVRASSDGVMPSVAISMQRVVLAPQPAKSSPPRTRGSTGAAGPTASTGTGLTGTVLTGTVLTGTVLTGTGSSGAAGSTGSADPSGSGSSTGSSGSTGSGSGSGSG